MRLRPLRVSFVLLLASAAAAQSQRISGELAHLPATLGGDVREAFFSLDGSRVLYFADGDVAGTIDLYSAPSDGSGAAVKLSTTLPGPYGSVDYLELTADGARVLFGPYGRLFSAPVDGSAPAVDLVDDLLFQHELTPDGSTVVSIEGDETTQNLYAGPADGSAPATLLLADIGEARMRVDALGERVVVVDNDCVTCPGDLLSLPIDGSAAPVLLNPGLPAFSAIQLASDGSRVVFPAAGLQLYSVPIDGSAPPTQLTGAIEAFGLSFRIAPSSDRVVYAPKLGDEFDSWFEEIHSVPIDGSAAPVQLSGALVAGGRIGSFDDTDYAPFQISADGARVVYRADQQVLGRNELFAVPTGGGSAAKISGTIVPANGDVLDYLVTPDSVGVVFRADRLVDGRNELFAVPFGGGVFQLSQSGPAGGNVHDFRISADDLHVVYRGDMEANGRDDLFRVAITGGASTRLNAGVATSAVLAGYALSPDSALAAFPADELTNHLVEAFVAPIAGGSPAVRVSGELTAGPPAGDVTTFAALPGALGAVYVADGDDDEAFELYRATLAGGVSELSGTLAAGGDVQTLALAPDGARVLYLADALVDERRELFVVPADGSGAPARLSHELTGSLDVFRVRTSPASARAVYMTMTSTNRKRLWSVPIDASAAPVVLSPASHELVLGDTLVFSPDGATVVYDTFADLFAVPLDGSAAPVRLNGRYGPSLSIQLVLGERVRVTADGARVLYLADPTVNGRVELFSVPIGGAGSGGSYRLNAPLPLNGDVLQFDVAPDGSRVVYYADQEVDQRFELYSVPLARDGRFEQSSLPATSGAGRVKLNGPLVPGGQVGYGCCADLGFRMSPTGERVLFTANALSTGTHTLFSVALDGTQRVQLSTGNANLYAFSAGGDRAVYAGGGWVRSVPVDGSAAPLALIDYGTDFEPFTLSPDGEWVLVRTDVLLHQRYALLARPLDGSLPATLLSGPSIDDGDVGGHFGESVPPLMAITSDATHVIYGADQDDDDVHELYASELPDLP